MVALLGQKPFVLTRNTNSQAVSELSPEQDIPDWIKEIDKILPKWDAVNTSEANVRS